jgi:DNA-binding MarR family transcriptional regulator
VTESERQWTFLTSHGLVLLEVARTPDATVRELAVRVRLTERQAHRVLADLAEAGYIVRQRVGRRNHYRINETIPMRHPTNMQHDIGALLAALGRR